LAEMFGSDSRVEADFDDVAGSARATAYEAESLANAQPRVTGLSIAKAHGGCERFAVHFSTQNYGV
jgi:hypothetical protein